MAFVLDKFDCNLFYRFFEMCVYRLSREKYILTETSIPYNQCSMPLSKIGECGDKA